MKIKIRSAHTSVWAVAAIATTVIGATAGFAAYAAPSDKVSDSADWSESFGRLKTPQSEKDLIPSSLTEEGSSFAALRDETTRLVGSDDVANYWAAVDADGKLCLVAHLHGEHQVAASSCTPTVATFHETGVPLQIDSIDGALRAYLVPDGASLNSDQVAALTPNLIVGDPYQASNEAVEVQLTDPALGARSGASPLRLLQFEPADGSWRE